MYEGRGEGRPVASFEGVSKESLDDAIRAAVGSSDVEDGTTLIVSHIEVTTVGDPNIGSYKVVLHHGGG